MANKYEIIYMMKIYSKHANYLWLREYKSVRGIKCLIMKYVL